MRNSSRNQKSSKGSGQNMLLFTTVFGAVIDPNGAGLFAPFDDPIKAPVYTLGGQREIDLNPQAGGLR